MNRTTVRSAFLGAIGGWAIFLVLTVMLLTTNLLCGIDDPVHGWAVHHRSAQLTTTARTVTDLGGAGAGYLIFAGLMVVAALVPGGWWIRLRAMAAILVIGLGGVLLRLVLVVSIGRVRPPRADWVDAAGGLSFPSGHTSTATIAAGLVIATVLRLRVGRRCQGIVAVLACLCAVAVGLTRIYLGVHWPTDVLAGWSFGIGWVASTFWLLPRAGQHCPHATPAAGDG